MFRGFASMADLDYAVDAMKARLSALKPSEDGPHNFSIQNYLAEEEKLVTLVVKDISSIMILHKGREGYDTGIYCILIRKNRLNETFLYSLFEE
jgi:hypothetical protein